VDGFGRHGGAVGAETVAGFGTRITDVAEALPPNGTLPVCSRPVRSAAQALQRNGARPAAISMPPRTCASSSGSLQ
jgi:hypothetical protein